MQHDDGSSVATIFPRGWVDRLWFFWVAVAVPAISFGFSAGGLHLVEWQDPALATWPGLFLDHAATRPFLPLVTAVVACCLAIVVRPGAWVGHPAVRGFLGLGLLIAAPYGVATLGFLVLADHHDLATGILRVAAAWAVVDLGSIGVARLVRWLVCVGRRRLGGRRFAALASGVVVLVWGASTVWLATDHPWSSPFQAMLQAGLAPFGMALIASLVAGPVWSFRALWRLWRRIERERPIDFGFGTGAVVVAGLAAYLLAWRLAVDAMVRAHAALPAQRPDCFVATAATQGPAWLVGGERVPMAGGGCRRITPQLQRFKLFELALQTGAPHIHRRIRRVYDSVGPSLAARLRGPGRAALAWLMLKPAEWLAAGAVRLMVGGRAPTLRRQLYGSEPGT